MIEYDLNPQPKTPMNVAPELAVESTVIFIKPMPDNFPQNMFPQRQLIEDIRSLAQEMHLTEKHAFVARLTSDALGTIYPTLTPELKVATHSHLMLRKVNTFVFEGKLALRRMAMIIGDQANPSRCHPETIRHRWWLRTKDYHLVKKVGEVGLDLPGGGHYWYNFAHCSRTPAEFIAHYAALIENGIVGEAVL